MKRPRIAFRCDGSAELGMGHVVGCLRLAGRLSQAGVRASFVMRDHPAASGLVRDAGHEIDFLPQGLSPQEEVDHLIAAARNRGCSGVTVNFDKAGLEALSPYFHCIKDAGLGLFFLDHPIPPSCWLADVLINALPHPDYDGYDPRKHPACYDGLEYLLLDDAHEELRRTPRTIRDHVEQVLVAMGGGDASNTTRLVLEALSAAAFDGYVDVVLGAANPHETEVRAFFDTSGLRGSVQRACRDMPERIALADMGFSSLGLTTYEMAALSLPVVIIAGNAFNSDVAKGYAKKYGSAVHLAKRNMLNPARISTAFRQLAGDVDRRRRMAGAGRFIGSKADTAIQRVLASAGAKKLNINLRA